MKKGLVNIAQGSPEQLSKLKIFIENMKNIYPDRKLKTLAYGVEFAVEQAQKVPELEKENTRLRKVIIELEKKQFTEEERNCIRDSLISIDLCDTEDEEYNNAVESVLRKLRM